MKEARDREGKSLKIKERVRGRCRTVQRCVKLHISVIDRYNKILTVDIIYSPRDIEFISLFFLISINLKENAIQ